MQAPKSTGYNALRKGRYSTPNGIYFITFVTEQRIPWFTDDELASSMCRSLFDRRAIADATMLCFVVMPDHVHFLISLKEVPLERVLQQLKSRSARTLNNQIGRKGRFWECGFYDYSVRKDEDLVGIARYIVANPLRSRLVNKLGDYPYWNAKWL